MLKKFIFEGFENIDAVIQYMNNFPTLVDFDNLEERSQEHFIILGKYIHKLSIYQHDLERYSEEDTLTLILQKAFPKENLLQEGKTFRLMCEGPDVITKLADVKPNTYLAIPSPRRYRISDSYEPTFIIDQNTCCIWVFDIQCGSDEVRIPGSIVSPFVMTKPKALRNANESYGPITDSNNNPDIQTSTQRALCGDVTDESNNLSITYRRLQKYNENETGSEESLNHLKTESVDHMITHSSASRQLTNKEFCANLKKKNFAKTGSPSPIRRFGITLKSELSPCYLSQLGNHASEVELPSQGALSCTTANRSSFSGSPADTFRSCSSDLPSYDMNMGNVTNTQISQHYINFDNADSEGSTSGSPSETSDFDRYTLIDTIFNFEHQKSSSSPLCRELAGKCAEPTGSRVDSSQSYFDANEYFISSQASDFQETMKILMTHSIESYKQLFSNESEDRQIKTIARLKQLHCKAEIRGVLIDIGPDFCVDNPWSLVKGRCYSGCKQLFSINDGFSHPIKKVKCKHCKMLTHYECPRCLNEEGCTLPNYLACSTATSETLFKLNKLRVRTPPEDWSQVTLMQLSLRSFDVYNHEVMVELINTSMRDSIIRNDDDLVPD